jgi:hypothetical protein
MCFCIYFFWAPWRAFATRFFYSTPLHKKELKQAAQSLAQHTDSCTANAKVLVLLLLSKISGAKNRSEAEPVAAPRVRK